MKTILILLKLILLNSIMTSCASYNESTISTMEDRERPEWATLSKTVYKKGGRLFVVGYTEGLASNRISALMRISDNNARFEVSREITNQMNYIYQNLEEGVGDGGQLSRFYGTEVSKHLSNGIRQERRFWEKVKVYDENGDPLIRTRVYSLISMKESDLRKAIRNTIFEKREITKAIKEKIDSHMISEVDKMMN